MLSVHDPVRIYEDFATIDLISNGRTEIIAGRGSTIGTYHTLGYDVNDYEQMFEEKFDLLLKLNSQERITWEGKFRLPLKDAHILPRPLNGKLPIWRAVGGSPESAIKAGLAGAPMTLATLSGTSDYFKPAVDVYRQAAAQAGHDPAKLPVATTTMLYAADNSQDAQNEFYPYINHVYKVMRGMSFPKERFLQSANVEDAMMVGSPQLIIEKYCINMNYSVINGCCCRWIWAVCLTTSWQETSSLSPHKSRRPYASIPRRDKHLPSSDRRAEVYISAVVTSIFHSKDPLYTRHSTHVECVTLMSRVEK